MVLALFAPEVCPWRFVLLIMHLSTSACSIQILYYCVFPILLGIVQGRSVFLGVAPEGHSWQSLAGRVTFLPP
jgi:hypothetical protein